MTPLRHIGIVLADYIGAAQARGTAIAQLEIDTAVSIRDPLTPGKRAFPFGPGRDPLPPGGAS